MDAESPYVARRSPPQRRQRLWQKLNAQTTQTPEQFISVNIRKSSPKTRPADCQLITVIALNTKGATNYERLYRLLGKEMDYGCEFDPTDEFDTTYFCDGYTYQVGFDPATSFGLAYLCLLQHICLVFTYDASSKESWDKMVAAYERIYSRCEDGVLPFLATAIAAMVDGFMAHEEAETFARERGCLFFKFSPVTGQGVCRATGSLVELAHRARDQYAPVFYHSGRKDPETEKRDRNRAEAIQPLFAQEEA